MGKDLELPAGVELRAGQLSVDFESLADLLGKLSQTRRAVLKAIGSDPDSIRQLAEPRNGEPRIWAGTHGPQSTTRGFSHSD